MNTKKKSYNNPLLPIKPFNRILTIIITILTCFLFINPAFTATKTVLEKTFVRNTGKPTTETVSFSVSVADEGTLKIINGPNGGKQISSANISLNGQEIVGPDKFNQNVATIEVPVQLLKGDNTLNVKLNSNPGGSISVQVAVELIAPPLVTKEVPVQLTVLQNYNIQLDGLIISTLLSEHTLAAGETTAEVLFADADKGQILFITDTTGTPFIVAYISATDIQSGNANITLNSIANGLIMANPIMMGYKQSDRLAILSYAQTNSLYEDLKGGINNALQIEPYNLLQEAIFPKIYEYAAILIIEAIKNHGVITTAMTAKALPLMAPSVTVGKEDTPYLSDVSGRTIMAVNPTMAFYGLTVSGKPPQVIAGKESVWELRMGWPPAQFIDPVTKIIDLGDGNFNITFSKSSFGNLNIDLSDPARNMADNANLLRLACIMLDTLFWCPLKNETLEAIVEKAPLADRLLLAANDILSQDTVEKAIKETLEKLANDKELWRDITQMLYANAADKEAAVTFLKASKKVLEAASTVIKFLKAYDAVNVTIPFVWDWLFMQPTEFCINQNNGILTATCQFIPPTAIITKISPNEVYVGDTVVFDASRSFDDIDGVGSLMVRWDFNGDGVYDTDWSTEKTGKYSYKNVGAYDVRLQVIDKDNLIGQTVFTVVVRASNAGGTATHIKAFRDVLPWDTTSFEITMAANGYTAGSGEKQYEILPSSAFATGILTPGTDLVVITNDQDQTFYNNLANNLSRLDRFIQNGGIVIWGACDEGWHYGSMAAAGINALPGGVQYMALYDQINYNVNLTTTLMTGLPSTLSGTYASHEHFLNVPVGSIVYMKDTANYPTLAEYKYGSGWMMLTGQPLEYNVVYNTNSMGVIYPRLFNYVLGRVVNATPAAVHVMEQAVTPPFSHIDE
ncbi:MAG: PKD domain-containing protein [Candidatus Competibacter sp.]